MSNKDNNNQSSFSINTISIIYISVCLVFLIVFIFFYKFYVDKNNMLIEKNIESFKQLNETNLNNFYNSLNSVTNINNDKIEEIISKSLEANMYLLKDSLKSSYDFGINSISFWLAFLSFVMIIFTILGIYANNKILESNQRQS